MRSGPAQAIRTAKRGDTTTETAAFRFARGNGCRTVASRFFIVSATGIARDGKPAGDGS
jgi:hypothetical protein